MEVLIYIVCKNKDEAKSISFKLIEVDLVPCCNISPGINSIYKWEGKLCEEEESILIAKTVDANVEQVKELVLKLHSYTCPAIVHWKIDGGNPDYLNWINKQVGE